MPSGTPPAVQPFIRSDKVPTHRAKYTVDTSEDELGRTLPISHPPPPTPPAGSSRIRIRSRVCANRITVCASHRGVIIPSSGRRTRCRKAVTETVVTGRSCSRDPEAGHEEYSHRLSSAAISSGSTFTRPYVHVLPDRLCVIVRFPHFIMSALPQFASGSTLSRRRRRYSKPFLSPRMGLYHRVHPLSLALQNTSRHLISKAIPN